MSIVFIPRDSVIQRYERMGVRFAFRLTAFEGNKNEDGVPKWLRDAGCPGLMAKPYGVEHWEVDYAAPMFLEKLGNFLNAVGKREVRAEANKVTWPTRRETMITTGLVILMVLFASLFFVVVDSALRFLVGLLLRYGQ